MGPNCWEREGHSRRHSSYWVSVSRSEEHTSELQSRFDLVCRLLLEKKKKKKKKKNNNKKKKKKKKENNTKRKKRNNTNKEMNIKVQLDNRSKTRKCVKYSKNTQVNQ